MERRGAWGMAWTGTVVLLLGLAGAAPSRSAPTAIGDAREAHVIDSVQRSEPDGRTVAAQLPQVVSRTPADGAWVERSWRFAFTTGAQHAGLALYLSGVSGHSRIVLNGQVLRDTITDPPAPLPRALGRLVLLDLPPHLLAAGDNRVEITVRGSDRISLSRIALGPQAELRDERDAKALAMVYGPAVVAALISCLGLAVLLIWSRRRQEPVYGYFGVASLAWGLHTAWSVAPRSLIGGVHEYIWWTTLYGFLVAMLTIFCLRFVGDTLPRVERMLKGSVIALPAFLYASVAVGLHDEADTVARLAMVVAVFAALAAVARRAWQARSLDHAMLVVAGLAAGAFGARDWWVSEVGGDNLPVHMTPYAGLPFVVLLAWLLIDRFVRANASLEALNRELESRVASKSAQLVSALDHMRAARDWAESANRSKSGFLAAASHDLRQPIHALGLYLGALRQRALDAPTQDIVERMHRSVSALDSLLNALLDVSRIDAGALVPQPRAFDLEALLRRLGDEFAPDAAERGLRFALRIGAAPRPVAAHSDGLLVERVLRNLIANAVKYTRQGGVLVSCRWRQGDPAHWRVEVWDTGPGIAPDERERVFEEFYQGGNAARDRRGGLGLGLSIVRRLARLLDLPLALHSQPGRGTRFVLDLQATREIGAAPPPIALASALDGTVVAVIEDDVEVREAMQTLLHGWGCEVVQGDDADAVLRSATAASRVPQAVVADLRLRDGRDGVAEVARLRAALGAGLPALLVSGDSAPERVRLMAVSGLPWLSKPVAAGRLRAWLSQVTRHEQAHEVAS